MHAAACVAKVEMCGVHWSTLLLDKYNTFMQVIFKCTPLSRAHMNIPDAQLRTKSDIQTTFIVAAEAGEVIVPMNYALCWFIVRVGPNSKSFSGSGTSDFGLEAPDEIGPFIGNIAGLFCAEVVSSLIIKAILWYGCGISMMARARKACQMFGPILVCQSVWIIVTSFCMTMIHCGLDWSFQWDYL